MTRNPITPYSRDYRRPPGRNMAPRPKPPNWFRRFLRRIADPLFYLRAVIVLAGLGLILLPLAADAVNAIARPVSGPNGTCRILSVIDGDTVSLWCEGQGVSRARLVGFDTPEMFSPRCPKEFIAAQQATWALRWMILRAHTLRLTPLGQDRYHRRLVSLMLDGQSVARRMIKAGHARAYSGGKRGGWCG
jgi:micrococcal nuclease